MASTCHAVQGYDQLPHVVQSAVCTQSGTGAAMKCQTAKVPTMSIMYFWPSWLSFSTISWLACNHTYRAYAKHKQATIAEDASMWQAHLRSAGMQDMTAASWCDHTIASQSAGMMHKVDELTHQAVLPRLQHFFHFLNFCRCNLNILRISDLQY